MPRNWRWTRGGNAWKIVIGMRGFMGTRRRDRLREVVKFCCRTRLKHQLVYVSAHLLQRDWMEQGEATLKLERRHCGA